MNFDPNTSESRILSLLEPYSADLASAIYSAFDTFKKEDRGRYSTPSDRTFAAMMWERNKEACSEIFSTYTDDKVNVKVTDNDALFCIFEETCCGWIKKTPDGQRVSTRTNNAQSFARQEEAEEIPSTEHFYITYCPNIDWSEITVHISYPRPSGKGFLWCEYLDREANIVPLSTANLNLDQSDARKYPYTPKAKPRIDENRK